MSSSRPYLLRALHEWIVDNGCTPHLLVDAHVPGVEVPQQYVKNGQIVLNVSPTAVADLFIGNEEIRFRGRFGGIAVDVVAPTAAILGIYARENGQGMVFEAEPSAPPPAGGDDAPARTGAARPSLRVVK
jgi:stringent starvation protein B